MCQLRSTSFFVLLTIVVSILFGHERTLAKLRESECANIDLSPKLGDPLHQGDTGWCYAFVAADLITLAQGLGPDQRVSALDVAIAYLTASSEKLRKLKNVPVDLADSAAKLLQQDQERFKRKPLIERTLGLTWVAVLAYQTKQGLCQEKELLFNSPAFNKATAIRERLVELGDTSKLTSGLQNEAALLRV